MGFIDLFRKKSSKVEPQVQNTVEPHVKTTVQKEATNIVRKARGTEIPKRAQRIFLSCDASNAKDRDTLIADLLSMDAGMDCVVSFLETPGIDSDEKLLKNELQDTQLLVLWVTKELLQIKRNGRFPIEYRIAQELHTPILPIANDAELFPEFTKLADAIHGIARSDSEYRIKLKAQLETFLASEALIEEIRKKAFTAEMFLSYRKIDIDEARRFMKEFHNIKEFEAVSIWYDNFLTAGRIFDEEIRKSISKCDVFTLLTTPNLLKKNIEGKDNYVVSTEYPFAVKQGKPIVAVETTFTNQSDFAALFPKMKTVRLDNSTELYAAFCNKLKASSRLEQIDSKSSILFGMEQLNSERSYLLGIAYLKGLGVERDTDRAIRLLETASEICNKSAYLAAMQLANIYQNGIGTSINYNKELYWGEKATAYSELLFGLEDAVTAKRYANTAANYSRQGDYKKALEWHLKALAIEEKISRAVPSDITATFEKIRIMHQDSRLIDPDVAATARTYGDIAIDYSKLGDYAKALEWHLKALTMKEKVLGVEHPDTAFEYNNIAAVYIEQGNFPKALEYSLKALEIQEKVLGIEHLDTAGTYDTIATIFSRQGNYPKTLEWSLKALAIREKILGTEHPDIAITYGEIAYFYCIYQSNFPEALKWFQKALAIQEKVLGKVHPVTAETYNRIAVTYFTQGDCQKALEWAHKSLSIKEKILGIEHPETAAIYCTIAAIYDMQGENLKVLEWLHKALAIQEKAFGIEHPNTAKTYSNIAVGYYKKGDCLKSLEYAQKALAIQEKVIGIEHPDTAATYCIIAVIYDIQGDIPKALEWFYKALTIQEKVFGIEHQETAKTYGNIAVGYYRQGNSQKALEWFQKALAIQEKILGANHPNTILTYNNINIIRNKLKNR